MSDTCEGSPVEDVSTIAFRQFSSGLVEAAPEPEMRSIHERETSQIEQDAVKAGSEIAESEQRLVPSSSSHNEEEGDLQTTTVKRFVIADSDDDVTDDEDDRPGHVDGRPFATDHDYAVSCDSRIEGRARSNDGFPELPGLSELGLISDDHDVSLEQHVPSDRISLTHPGYDTREASIISRTHSVREGGIYRTADGYVARPVRSIPPVSGCRSSQVALDRGLPHSQQEQQQQSFVLPGYNGTPVARRVIGAVPSSAPIIQKRTAPRIVSSSSQMRPPGSRLSVSASHLGMPQYTQRQMTNAAPPVQRQVDPPPHRSFHQSPDPSSQRFLMMQPGGVSRVAFSPADPSQAALANAPAPLLVSSRGTRPIVRGRGVSVSGSVKKECMSGVMGEEASPTHSPQAVSRIPTNTPVHGNRVTPPSPRKQVHFSDVGSVDPTSIGASTSYRMQVMPPTSVQPAGDSVSHQSSIRSPLKFSAARVRAQDAPTESFHDAVENTATDASSPRAALTAETPTLPENLIDDVNVTAQSYQAESHKNSSLPPEVMAAATSLSAEADVNHPQWTNNEISAEDIKAKIEAISREIAQEMEQKKMESEAQAREKRRAVGESPSSTRRRPNIDSVFNIGEDLDGSGLNALSPRARGRPKGSGRTRSSLSSSSSTSVAATSTGTPAQHDIAERQYGSTRSSYQSPQSATRASARTAAANSVAAYDDLMAPELPPSLPPSSLARGTYRSPNVATPSQLPSMNSSHQGLQQTGINGLSPEEDLANVSTDPSSDEEQAAEEAEWGDYVTRCLCEMQHNDEWMVECEKCNVWQHMKCMGIDPKKFNQNDTYLCEQCKPRPLRWTKKQAQELQLKQLRAVSREKERKMAEKLKRREERKRAKLNQRLKERNHAKTIRRGPAAYKKFQMIDRNEYTRRAKQMLALFDTTAGAQSILESSRDLKRGKRMFVAPDIEGLVSTEAIKQDDVIMEYVGHVCLPDECPGRLQRGALQPYCVLYNGLGQNLLCIDARRQGSEARFARRCCRSNSTLKHVLLNGSIYVMLVASERIEKGTEVTIPFDCDFRDTLVPVECACGDDPNCYMKQFNNTLRNKLSLEERANNDVPQRPQTSNGVSSSRRAASVLRKSKAESRGRLKGSARKETATVDTPRRKGPGGRKARRVGIRLRRHSDSKNTKSDDSVDQTADEETDNKQSSQSEERKENSEVEQAMPETAPQIESGVSEVKTEEEGKTSAEDEEPPTVQDNAEPQSPKNREQQQSPPKIEPPQSSEKVERVQSPKKAEESASSELIQDSQSPKKVEQPKSPKKVEQPKSPRKVEQPKSPKKVEQPKSPKKVEQPKSPKKTEEPRSPKKDEQALSPSKVEQSKSPKKNEATKSPKKQNAEANKTTNVSPKKEEQKPGGRRRNSTGTRRFSKREALELQEVMDYTLPEDRNKPSREERKLQAALAALQRQEEKAKKKKAEAHKSVEVKEKKGPVRTSRTSTGGLSRGQRVPERIADSRVTEKNPDGASKDKKAEGVIEQAVRESPRARKKREDFKENEVEVATVVQPPRKRWAAAVKENEAAQRTSSPEVTSSSSASTGNVDAFSPTDSLHTASVGGKKLWLRRHAAESISEESVHAAETSASSEPLSCAADSTSDITTNPARMQMSPPLKKRRHIFDACPFDEHDAATALAQMGGSAEGFRFHWNMALRYLMPNLGNGLEVNFNLAENLRKPLPPPTPRQTATDMVSVDTAATMPTSSQVSMVSAVENVKKAKRLTLEDYKRRRSAMGSSDSSNTTPATSTQIATENVTVKDRTGDSRPTRSFIPNMDTAIDQNLVLRPLDATIPIPPLGMPPDLEVVKKMILQESCIPSPPVPPTLPSPTEPPAAAEPVATSSSDIPIGSNSESGEERMSLADRLAKEFGVGIVGTPRQESQKVALSSTRRLISVRDVPPPPPPGPRPTRNTRW